MEYRLVCIYQKKADDLVDVRVEVGHETGSRGIPPFVRKVSTDELLESSLSVDGRALLYILNQNGLEVQPFVLNGDICSFPSVSALLSSYPWSYVQTKRYGSLKKGTYTLYSIGRQNPEQGAIDYGELTIIDLTHWNRKIDVRIKYKDGCGLLYPFYNPYPYKTDDGSFKLRSADEENRLLSMLQPYKIADDGTISVKDNDIDFLYSLRNAGWRIRVPRQGNRAYLHFHQSSSGIKWFSTEAEDTDDNVANILQAYLKGRNYVELEGKFAIYDTKSIEKSGAAELTEYIKSSGSPLSLYEEPSRLSAAEKSAIEAGLSEKIEATLRPYQKEGVLWLAEMRKNRRGCLLADEMGLGKTLQIISHLATIEESGLPHLIIAPTSLLSNWEREIRRFCPSLSDAIQVQPLKPDCNYKIILVSYDILRIHIEDFLNVDYDTIVIDEAQIIKNRQTKKYLSIAKLSSIQRIILTGTPIENSVDEIWSHFMLLSPELSKVYAAIRNESTDADRFALISSKLLSPFILRRTKEEVLGELPPRTVKNIYLEMSDKERAIYENIHRMVSTAISFGISGRVSSIALEGLLRLRQACVSPSLLPESINGNYHEPSTKQLAVVSLLNQFIKEKRKTLLFSQFTSVLHEMETLLNEANIRYVALYGDTRDRSTPVSKFQTSSEISVFLISLKAGGVGLNLTAADRVIMMDDWWNPAVEEQAFARSHRIGQKNPVLILRMICRDTVEEKILLLQDKKKHAADIFERGGEKLSLEDLRMLLS